MLPFTTRVHPIDIPTSGLEIGQVGRLDTYLIIVYLLPIWIFLFKYLVLTAETVQYRPPMNGAQIKDGNEFSKKKILSLIKT